MQVEYCKSSGYITLVDQMNNSMLALHSEMYKFMQSDGFRDMETVASIDFMDALLAIESYLSWHVSGYSDLTDFKTI